jgi:hypothetical protein
LRRQIVELDHKESSIKALLAEEEARWEKMQPALFENGNGAVQVLDVGAGETRVGQTPLAKFLVRSLADHRPHSLADLVAQAEQAHFDFGIKNPGRSIHFALIGLQRNRYVRRLESGTWRWEGRQ